MPVEKVLRTSSTSLASETHAPLQCACVSDNTAGLLDMWGGEEKKVKCNEIWSQLAILYGR